MICSSWACTVAAVGKVDPGAQDGFISVGEVEASTISCDGANGGGSNRRLKSNLSILRRRNRSFPKFRLSFARIA
ncbi:hypothetical protein I3842_04G136100 [Carya illinoinensis]|uniref:Uncharacterized protein n=1 Tax=Carya illinoinensis TaxID=32201 RepID=A0A922JVM9_CARIL|nr:hypothetical protein I3842_04G136100 [Carya illinoinensis]